VVLWQEAQIARERENRRFATEATLLDAVITAQMASGKSGAREHLTKLLKGLQNGG
jgi:hypothetical protein